MFKHQILQHLRIGKLILRFRLECKKVKGEERASTKSRGNVSGNFYFRLGGLPPHRNFCQARLVFSFFRNEVLESEWYFWKYFPDSNISFYSAAENGNDSGKLLVYTKITLNRGGNWNPEKYFWKIPSKLRNENDSGKNINNSIPTIFVEIDFSSRNIESS